MRLEHALILSALLATACATPDPRSADGFARWRANNSDEVAAFETHLRGQELHELVPLAQLLRSASSWEDCQAAPYAVPPAAQWADASAVLQLIQALKAQGVLGAFEVHSSYRNPALNACAGGATRSAHLLAYAVDLTPASPPALPLTLEALCSFWRTQGAVWKMGLGRYASGRIHIDTYGWRTWGGDGTARTSLCQTAS